MARAMPRSVVTGWPRGGERRIAGRGPEPGHPLAYGVVPRETLQRAARGFSFPHACRNERPFGPLAAARDNVAVGVTGTVAPPWREEQPPSEERLQPVRRQATGLNEDRPFQSATFA